MFTTDRVRIILIAVAGIIFSSGAGVYFVRGEDINGESKEESKHILLEATNSRKSDDVQLRVFLHQFNSGRSLGITLINDSKTGLTAGRCTISVAMDSKIASKNRRSCEIEIPVLRRGEAAMLTTDRFPEVAEAVQEKEKITNRQREAHVGFSGVEPWPRK